MVVVTVAIAGRKNAESASWIVAAITETMYGSPA